MSDFVRLPRISSGNRCCPWLGRPYNGKRPGRVRLTMGPYIGSQLAKLALGIPLDIDIDAYDIRTAIEER